MLVPTFLYFFCVSPCTFFMKQNYFSNIYVLRFIQIRVLKWYLHKVSRQGKFVLGQEEGIDSYWPGSSSVCFLLTNACFPSNSVPVLRQESCWGCGFSLLVGVLAGPLKPASDYHHTCTCRVLNAANEAFWLLQSVLNGGE